MCSLHCITVFFYTNVDIKCSTYTHTHTHREREREREIQTCCPLSSTVRKIHLATFKDTIGVIKGQYNIMGYRRRTNRHSVNQTLHINKRLSNMNSLRPVLSRMKGSSCSNSGTRRRTIVK